VAGSQAAWPRGHLGQMGTRRRDSGPRGREEPRMKKSAILKNQSGAVGVMAAFLMIVLIAFAGLAIDLGRMFVVRAQLVKAVDGGALAGARVLPMGQDSAEDAAVKFAEMNFAQGFMGAEAAAFSAEYSVAPDAVRIEVVGTAVMPMTLMRIVGVEQAVIDAVAEAQRRPLELALVLDTSGSLDPSFTGGVDAIGYLRSAATQFVNFFDETMDMMTLVRFNSGRIVPFPLNTGFKQPITANIATFNAFGGTNAASALDAGHDEIRNPVRPAAFRALVFFTDGRPTALRELFNISGQDVDGVIGGYQDPTRRPYPPPYLYDPFKVIATREVHLRLRRPGGGWYPSPSYLPDGTPASTANIMQKAWQRTLDAGSQARDDGITIFTIGLGNPAAGPVAQPDPELLVAIANVQSAPDPLRPGQTIVNQYYDPSQPKGGFYFAPDATGLEELFRRVGQEITVRLTR